MFFLFENWGIQLFCLISRANVVLELLKSRLEVRYNALQCNALQCNASAASKFCRRGVVDDAKQSRITSSCNPQASAGINPLFLSDV